MSEINNFMSDWLIVGVALVVAILFLVYQANKEEP